MNTIAVAGCTGHIGTTTQAIQLVLALKEKGFKSCYLEMNKTGYLENLLALYGSSEDKVNLVRFSGIEMFKRDFTSTIKNGNYDYIIKDYGSVNKDTFDDTFFASEKIKIIVCGSKPNEVFKAINLSTNLSYKNAYFVFNLVPINERDTALSMIGDCAERTFFAGITFDPFILIPESEKVYQSILSLNKSSHDVS